jgi:hypothetical protein
MGQQQYLHPSLTEPSSGVGKTILHTGIEIRRSTSTHTAICSGATVSTAVYTAVAIQRSSTYRYCLRELRYLLVLLDSNSSTVATPGTKLSQLGQLQIMQTHKGWSSSVLVQSNF